MSLADNINQELRGRNLRHWVNAIEDNDGEAVVWADGMGHAVQTVDQAVHLACEQKRDRLGL